jgi:hypothetical protein
MGYISGEYPAPNVINPSFHILELNHIFVHNRTVNDSVSKEQCGLIRRCPGRTRGSPLQTGTVILLFNYFKIVLSIRGFHDVPDLGI